MNIDANIVIELLKEKINALQYDNILLQAQLITLQKAGEQDGNIKTD